MYAMLTTSLTSSGRSQHFPQRLGVVLVNGLSEAFLVEQIKLHVLR